MKQFRIYYESLEQGANFIKPIIQEVVGDDAEIVLVRRPKNASELNEGSVAALLTMTTPDALITGIYDNREYPLVLIEFTEAVTTEDHELQRTYGAIAAYLAGAYYLKLAGEKESEKEFGGASYNPYSTPKIFIEKVGYEGYIIAKWETEENNPYTLQRSPDYPSCPPNIGIFVSTIQCAVSAFMHSHVEWYRESLSSLSQTEEYNAYRALVEDASGISELLESWQNRRDSNLNKLRYFVRDEWIGAKINRFSHATDPDRGILTFISFLFSEEAEIYGIYALVRPRSKALRANMGSLEDMKSKLKTALDIVDKKQCSIPKWLSDEIKRVTISATSLNDEVDFQEVWERNKDRLSENKTVLTLAYFLDGLYLNHNGIKLKWDRKKLLGSLDGDAISAFASYFGFKQHSAPTNISPIINDVNEDEVTYTLVHQILKPNGFNIVSVSYPGAQGSMAILPQPELGKAQPREYLDAIAVPPANCGIDVILNESKGMFNLSEIRKDVDKIMLYKTCAVHQQALKEALVVAQVVDSCQEIANIVVGVSFGVKSQTRTTWDADSVDFIMRIVDRNRWAIGIFKQELASLISNIEGDTDFPNVYICNKNN